MKVWNFQLMNIGIVRRPEETHQFSVKWKPKIESFLGLITRKEFQPGRLLMMNA